jgi:hypothetical protein
LLRYKEVSSIVNGPWLLGGGSATLVLALLLGLRQFEDRARRRNRSQAAGGEKVPN